MEHEEIVAKLKGMLEMAKELAALRDPALEGDIQIILAVLGDKLRYMDPEGSYKHLIEYE
ncbi:MAG: hypothetical protein ACE5NP_03990 [Anaerolineae bacterium]